MIRKLLFVLCLILLVASCRSNEETAPSSSSTTTSRTPQTHRVFYVNSYHRGYPWSDGIERAIVQGLHADIDQPTVAGKIELAGFAMDSKRKSGIKQIEAAAQQAYERIKRFNPEVVIVSDDNAVKYLVVPYLLKSRIPVVFCGLNWDSSKYHLPPEQVTGMVEVQLIDQLFKSLRPFAKGDRVAFLKGDDYSARVEAEAFTRNFGLSLDTRLVKSFDDWCQEYVKLQQESDLLLLGNPVSIPDWNAEEARQLIMKNTRIPSGSWDAWMNRYSLATFATSPEEQGSWAANTTLRILQGTPVADIPQVRNRQAKIYLNMPLAKRLDIRFPMTLIENAVLVGE